ncbi:MAG: 4Fe-4S binding protein [Candidatus Rokubacteria bacterium]|nr:4Fe-4S binding protein [Candidatus Rokubacteria bacterium]
MRGSGAPGCPRVSPTRCASWESSWRRPRRLPGGRHGPGARQATFSTEDGVVLVDRDRCIGCRYCIQACPYGARYLDPRARVADKCTFCYHRVATGLLPACVEACPTQARIFGDLRSKASRLVRFTRMNRIHVLKPSLNTQPKVYYAQLDGEVR